jgi:UDP-2,3-diacylglucosamine pyrophosphatase LpxH
MHRVTYTREELLSEHRYAAPQIEEGRRLHGGFDHSGQYISPRTLVRWPAVRAWQNELTRRGFPLVDASVRLLKRDNYPTVDQQKLLLAHGIGETLWNAMTLTSVVEGRARAFCLTKAPDFQHIVVEDVSGTVVGHLNSGLLYAHGLDESGDSTRGEGGHDTMWLAVRDALFGAGAYPTPDTPATATGRRAVERQIPKLHKPYEDWIVLLMNALLIEVRAEAFFSFCINVTRSPDAFQQRREEAQHAATLVERIRSDEAIHVAYLQTFVSELRSFTLRCNDGSEVPGAELLDPVWERMVEWHAVEQLDLLREHTRDTIVARLQALPNSAELIGTFDTLEHQAAAE